MKTKKSDTSSDKIVRPLNPLTQADKLETKNPLKDASLNSNNNNKVNLKGQSVSDLIDAQQQVSVLTPPSIWFSNYVIVVLESIDFKIKTN